MSMSREHFIGMLKIQHENPELDVFIHAYIVCVTNQYYVSGFFTRLWSVRKPLLFDTQVH